ncbi:MAG: T9SS type A sorting domain-containing protein [Porphyromonadaceae bacterium]|nr:T9SS type A sorting domain-containing protein [Porphyromonadaceae bacterium]
MRKITVFLAILVSFSVFSQKRNMIPNSNFEAGTALWVPSEGSVGVQVSNVNPINGEYSLSANGAEVNDKAIIASDQFLTANFGEQYKLTFKAKAEGGDAAVKASLLMYWAADRYELFSDQNVTVSGSDVKEYSLTSSVVGAAGMKQTDRMELAFDFTGLAAGVTVTIDDVQLVRIDDGGEWNGSIKINGDFSLWENNGFPNYWVFNGDGTNFYSITKNETTGTADVNIAEGRTTSFNCFTANIFMHYPHTFKDWDIVFTIESDVDREVHFALNSEDTYPNRIPSTPFTINKGVHTYIFPWLEKEDVHGWGQIWMDTDLGAIPGKVTYHSFYIIERIPLQTLTIEMPKTVAVGTKIPVSLWANPTNADNEVTLTVDNPAGKVEKENGIWYYTQLSKGQVTINATSIVDQTIKTTFVVNEILSSTNELNLENINAKYSKGYITVNGLEGNELINLYNVQGQQVKSVYNKNTINVSDFLNGVYILQVNRAGYTKTFKFVVR